MKTSTFCVLSKITTASGSGTTAIFSPTDPNISYYLQALRLKIAISSVGRAEIPALEPEMTRAEKIKIIRDLEWNSPRKELSLLQKTTGDWVELARVSCLNRPPYYSINLLQFLTDNADLPLGTGSSLGVRVVDVGHGLLSGTDELIVHGGGVSESSIPSTEPPPGGGGSSMWGEDLGTCTQSLASIGGTARQILPEQTGRKYLAISVQNGGDVWLGLGSAPAINNGLLLAGAASSYEVHYYSGSVWAISSNQSLVSITVCG
jgi:hypothetical protein